MIIPIEMEVSLAACRVNAQLTQQEEADKLGVSKQTVNNWEAGICEPTLTQLKKISKLSKIPVDFIVMQKKSNKIG